MNYTTLEAWRKCATELNALKAQEMALRKAVVAEIFNTQEEGTHVVKLDVGWQLKMTQPYTRTLDQKKAPKLLEALAAQNVTDAIKVKYELSVAAYRTLDFSTTALVNEALVTKLGTPSLELVAPKESV